MRAPALGPEYWAGDRDDRRDRAVGIEVVAVGVDLTALPVILRDERLALGVFLARVGDLQLARGPAAGRKAGRRPGDKFVLLTTLIAP